MSSVRLHVVDHPLAAARLTTLRDRSTPASGFRSALRELSMMLVYEALRNTPIEEVPVQTPLTETTGVRLAKPPLLVPILRAGLGMAEAAYGLVPEGQMGFVGLARNEQTHEPNAYMASLPVMLEGRAVMVLDPMLATGGSLAYCCGLLTDRGATDITVVTVLAAPEGLQRLEQLDTPLSVYTTSVDSHLDELAYIVPGLGDAGDRQFGAV